MAKGAKRISKEWIEQNREVFRDIFNKTDFLGPELIGEQGLIFKVCRIVIGYIAVLICNTENQHVCLNSKNGP